MTEKVKAVFDSGIVLQATLNLRGPAGQVMELLETGEVEFYISPLLLDETQDILYRPIIRRKHPTLADGRSEVILERLDRLAIMVTHHFRSLDYPRDPKDEPILNLAIHVRADFLVARDKDLLDLNNSRDFRLLYPFLRVLPPLEFLQAIADLRHDFPAS